MQSIRLHLLSTPLFLFFPVFRGLGKSFFSALRAVFALACLCILFFPADTFADVYHPGENVEMPYGANYVDYVPGRCTYTGSSISQSLSPLPPVPDCWSGSIRYCLWFENSVKHVQNIRYITPKCRLEECKCTDGCPPDPDCEWLFLCDPSTFSVSVSGPGYVDGDACGDPIFCPGGGCYGNSDPECACYVSITAHPNIDTGTVTIDCDSEYCSVSGSSASCAIGDEDGGESASCTVKFGDLCTDDTDGDGIVDAFDSKLDSPNSDLSFSFSLGFFSVNVDAQTLFEKLRDVGTAGGTIDWNDTTFEAAIKYLKYIGSDGSVVEYGDSSPSGDYVEKKCDPRYEYCGGIPADKMDDYFPCEIVRPNMNDIKPPSDTPILNPEIPDGVYTPEDGLNPDCGCFDTVNRNTAATVDMLKELHKVESVISDNVGLLVDNTNDIKSDISDIKSDISDMAGDISDMAGDVSDMKSDISDIADDTDDILDALNTFPEDIIDAFNTDAAKLSGDELDLTAEDLGGFTSEDQAGVQALAESEKNAFKQQLDAFNSELMNNFENRFQITSANEQCSFSAPVFGGQSLTFDACSYSGHLDTMGSYLLFLSYVSGVFIILKA